MKKPIVHVTDHALITYMEKVLMVDVEGLRRRVGRQVDRHLLDEFPDPCGVKVRGVVFRLKGETVTTCDLVNPNRQRRRAQRRAKR